jgi:hypothetical protein
MTTNLRSPSPDELHENFITMLESALLARALANGPPLCDERTRAVLQMFLIGTFNAAVHGLAKLGDGRGELTWEREGEGFRLVYMAPTGLACPLARLYPQGNDTWVALVVAGVRDDPAAAMAAAEWGVSRLTA